MAILEVQGLRKSFGGLDVLKGIDLSLEQGQVLSIIGPSGGGKTTLLRCINLLERPTAGKVMVNGTTLFDDSEPAGTWEKDLRKKRLHLGFVFQSFNLFPQYTALQNVMLAPDLLAREQPDYKRERRAVRERLRREAEGYLARVGLGDKLDYYPHQLSGGQQQRVAIARALAMQPDILCFDEPTSALDPELTGEVLKVIRSLADQRTTMLIVTHEMAFARDVSDQLVFMDGGVVVERGAPQDIINCPQEERTRQFLARFSET